MNRVVQFAMNTVLPVAMIAGTVMAGQALLASRERPVRPAEERAALLVEVTEAVSVTEAVAYESQGTVVPARQVALQALVSGPATRVHSQLVVGGLLNEGDTLLRVDPADYQLAIAEAQAAVTQAETQLELERGRQDIARREWALFEESGGTQNVDNRQALATREPQIAAALVAVEAAETRLRRAQLNYRRTRLESPFAALVRSESVENGQLVGPGSPIATLVDTSAFWIEVPIPAERLQSVRVPGLNSDVGSRVAVRFSVGAERVEREGRVIRLRGELADTGRLAVLLVEVTDPLELTRATNARRPLLLGAFVDVGFRSSETFEGVEIPRTGLREDSQAYVVTPERTLEFREVAIGLRDPQRVVLTSGVSPGELVVTNRVGGVTDGMSVRLSGDAPVEATLDTGSVAPSDDAAREGNDE